jgi:very-short-patch-repair endonuclease
VLIDGGLPPPEPQLWVYDEFGVPVYRIDLGYEKRRVGIEYDGQSHLDRDRMRGDRFRLNWLATRGWTMRLFTDRDLYRTPHQLVATVRATLT